MSVVQQPVADRVRDRRVPTDVLRIRDQLSEVLGIDEETLPFAGELMQVHPDERAWEGAIERVLRGFGISLLVPDEHYAAVAKWVDQTHLGARLVYHRVKAGKQPPTPASVVRKLEFKHDSPMAAWVEGEIARQFKHTCCDTLDEFRRATNGLTRTGQTKGGFRHTEDDRSRVDDRTRFVLGWVRDARSLPRPLPACPIPADGPGNLPWAPWPLGGGARAEHRVAHAVDGGRTRNLPRVGWGTNGERLRLEQERIGFGWVRNALEAIVPLAPPR